MEIPELLEELLPCIVKKKELKGVQNEVASKMLEEIQKENKVCLMKKALYGLKQAGRQWHKRLSEEFKEIGLKSLSTDMCVYIGKREVKMMIVAIYVDDMLIISSDLRWVADVKRKLSTQFELKGLGPVKYFLGIEFHQKDGFMKISQSADVEDVLKRFGMGNSKPVSKPMNPGPSFIETDETSTREIEEYPFRDLIGSLMYLAIGTRPDIAFSVNFQNQFNNCNRKQHWIAAIRVRRYLRGTTKLGITYKKSSSKLEGFVDADWAACTHDRRSYTGFVFTLANGAVTWEVKKQRTVALSTTEAEYMGLTEAAKEAIYLHRFLKQVEIGNKEVIQIYNDNQGAQKLAKNPVFHSRTKHINIRHHFIREVLERDSISLCYQQSAEMMADVLTKALSGLKHRKCIANCGMDIFK